MNMQKSQIVTCLHIQVVPADEFAQSGNPQANQRQEDTKLLEAAFRSSLLTPHSTIYLASNSMD